jgi:hypothetical protein
MRRLAIGLVLVLAACGGSDDSSGPTTTARETTTTVNERYGFTADDWDGAQRTAAEGRYEQATALTYGVGTNPDKMLEYGYDLCEMYEQQPVAEAIKDWALENGGPVRIASELGAAASDFLCP